MVFAAALSLSFGTATASYATTTYTYDRYGNALTIKDPLGQTESCTYDLAGNMKTKTDRNGTVTTYTYDGLGRMLTTNVAKGGVNIGKATINYGYTGLVRSMSNDGFSVTDQTDHEDRGTVHLSFSRKPLQ